MQPTTPRTTSAFVESSRAHRGHVVAKRPAKSGAPVPPPIPRTSRADADALRAREGGTPTTLSLRMPGGLPRGVSQQALSDFVRSCADAQWFTGKGRTIEKVDVSERAKVGDFDIALLDVHYQDGGHDVFHVPLKVEDGVVKDALNDPAFVRAMVAAVRDDRSLRASSGRVHFAHTDGAVLPADVDELVVKPLGVPQSNVSIKVGDSVMFKAYRKPEAGVPIEREVTAHLTAQKYANTPQLLGTLTMDTKSGPTTIGMLFELVKAQGDGWGTTLDALAKNDAGLIDRLALLGTRIGEMHKALGAAVEDPAFKPQPITREDLRGWKASISKELDDTIARATEKDPALGEKLRAARPGLLARLDRLDAIEPSGMKTRIHGDLHLGQVLAKDGDWMVLDFEGEPARTKEERRGFYTPLRDVAGMLRSFSYAAAEAGKNGADVSATFANDAGRAFVDAYKDAVAGTGLMPNDDAFDVILGAVELEKALYEVRYELTSRPAMVHIPAARVLEMSST